VGGDHDGFSFGEAAYNLDISTTMATEFDIAGLEPPFPLIDQHHLTTSAVEHRAFLYRQHGLRRAGIDFGIDIHIGPQHLFGVRQLDSYARGAGLRVEMRID